MLCRTHLIGLIALSSLLACSRRPPPPPPPPAPAAPKAEIKQGEQHFANLAQITYGGENAEAYWSFDGTKLVFQSRPAGQSCDQIFSLTLGDEGSLRRISTGLGATTCSYFLPGDQEIIYASTHLGGAGCPPRPDHSQGYVWPLYASYDIFKTSAAGGPPVPLTNTPGYDAEATVCPVDGSILFTSVRDGDLELYRMDKDGQNVVRLTSTPGYDGGGFFNRDCTKIVWRASRPTGDALADYQRLLAQGLVRPTKLELYVANADGSDAQQVTYLDAASFAPYWFPNRNRIIFSSNYGDPQGREFELWAIDADGTDLERITFSPGFDGFPMFSPDGSRLAFSSNRATAEGAHDTNVFVVGWLDGILEGQAPADRVMRDVSWLADPQRGGRGTGTAGLAEARDWLGTRFAEIGLAPAGSQGFLQPFEVTTKVTSGPATSLTLGGEKVPLTPLSGSVSGEASGRLVFAGYGIVDEKSGIDDYRGVDAKNKIVVVRRFVPKTVTGEDARRLGDLYYKGFVARRQGAAGLIVVDAPEPSAKGDALPDEAPFPPLLADGLGDSGLPAAIISRAAGTPLIERLLRRSRVQGTLKIDLVPEKATASNVVGRLAATGPSDGGVIVVGAHYDHLGLGGPSSLAPGIQAPHLGADDNASGVASLLEVARRLAAMPTRPRDVIFVAFSAEEMGVLGSSHFVKALPAGLSAERIVAMLNMDMVGRMRGNELQALGGESAEEWSEIVKSACEHAHVSCSATGDGYGPSDHTPFFAAGVPVLHFFTGPHGDYHKPSDSADKVNAAGIVQTAVVVSDVAAQVAARPGRLTLVRSTAPSSRGDVRLSGASLGTVPDYAGPKGGQKGMLLAGVRPGGAADRGGMKRGDILVKLGDFDITGVRDLMFALRDSKPGQTLTAVVVRDGKPLSLSVTLEKSAGRGSSHGAGSPDKGAPPPH